VPQTILKVETADISAIVLFHWYEWVIFWDTLIRFPEENMVLGCNLGPAINIGPAMARKILKENLIDSLLFDASSRVRTIR
jgi:hypothetical protein